MSAYNQLSEIDSESSNVNYIDVGIHNDLVMKKIVFDTSTNGNQFIAFYFENEDGKQFSHTEWEPRDADPTKLENKTVNQIKRIKHIATKYVSKEQFDAIKASDFKSFCEATINLLGNKFENVKVRAKITYNWNNYTSFPNYTPFLETMDVEKTKLTISSTDKMVKDIADKEVTVTSNPFENSVVDETSPIEDPAVTADGIPF